MSSRKLRNSWMSFSNEKNQLPGETLICSFLFGVLIYFSYQWSLMNTLLLHILFSGPGLSTQLIILLLYYCISYICYSYSTIFQIISFVKQRVSILIILCLSDTQYNTSASNKVIELDRIQRSFNFFTVYGNLVFRFCSQLPKLMYPFPSIFKYK